MKGIKKYIVVFFILFVFLLTASVTWALSLKGRVEEHTLKNGMKILILKRQYSPTVSFFMSFKVGSADEYSGISGTAHLLEHMLFKGTKMLGTRDYLKEKKILDEIDQVALRLDNEILKGKKADEAKINKLKAELGRLQKRHKRYVVKDEIDSIYSKNGGVGLNASTSYDITRYMVSLPSNRVDLWAKIESDRMLNPVLREFYSERDVVTEERRQRIDSSPDGKLYENFMAAAFIAHPYRRPIIGWMSDLMFLKKRTTERFFKTYYAPNNTVVAVVGDIDTSKTLEIIKKYFEHIPSQPIPSFIPTKEPEQMGERRLKVKFDANPSLIIGYHKPTVPDFDDYVFDIIDGILSSGRTSRFYKRLIDEEKIAVSVETANGLPGARYPNLFAIFAAPRHPHTTTELEQAIYREIERLKREPVNERELRKIKNQLQVGFIRALNSNSGLASKLSYYQTVAGDWRYIEDQLDVIERITPQDILKAVRKYLAEDNRTVAELVKKEKE
ncbi:MAG: pitrilysin family protein [Thermodesulfobacteriota bacterium]